MKYLLCAVTALMLAGTSEAKMRTESPGYKSGNVMMRGYLAWDDSVKGKRPAVLVVHDWMGEGPFSRQKAEALAKMGYIGFAVDVYGEGVRPTNAGEAGKTSGALKSDRPLLRTRLNAALQHLLTNPLVDAKRIGVIGFCFGGTSALELARSGANVAGAVSFHGSLDTPTPADAKNIRGKVLVLHGADDPGVPFKQVLDFNDEMKQAGVDYQIVMYGHAVHAFTNPAAGSDNSRGAAYNEKADKRSWEAMRAFFNEVFKAGR